jgi:signal peptidase I
VVFHPPESAEEGVCGPAFHTVEPGGAACEEPSAKEDTSVRFIKRVVAGPGDEIYVKEGHAYRKAAGTSVFTREQDSYIMPCEPVSLPECNFPMPIKIPRGHWFTMGDNRGHSDDSRFWGPVPSSWIVGVVTGIE